MASSPASAYASPAAARAPRRMASTPASASSSPATNNPSPASGDPRPFKALLKLVSTVLNNFEAEVSRGTNREIFARTVDAVAHLKACFEEEDGAAAGTTEKKKLPRVLRQQIYYKNRLIKNRSRRSRS